MNSVPDRAEIAKALTRIAREVLEDEDQTIDPALSLVREYGMDSLDLLDFTFSIEEVYDIRIGTDELRGRAKGELTEEEMVDDNGCISRKALAIMQAQIPEIPADQFVYGLRQEDIPSLLNINVFVRLVHDKLGKD